jgi:hypothetical protein
MKRWATGGFSRRTQFYGVNCVTIFSVTQNIYSRKKLIVAQLIKKYPAFYTNQNFITVFARTFIFTRVWASWIQYLFVNPISLSCILNEFEFPEHVLISLTQSVRVYTWENLRTAGWIFIKFDIRKCYWKMSGNFNLQLDQIRLRKTYTHLFAYRRESCFQKEE